MYGSSFQQDPRDVYETVIGNKSMMSRIGNDLHKVGGLHTGNDF